MEVQYMWPNGLTVDIKLQDFILENENEIFVVAHNDEEGYSLLGIVEGDDNVFYFYHIKHVNKMNMLGIINGDIDGEYELPSNVSTGFWTMDTFIKKRGIPSKLQYFLSEQPIEIVQKGPYTHEDNSFMVYGGMGLYNLKKLKKA